MTRTFQSLDLFVLSCLFLTIESGLISLPQNVSLRWISDFEPQLSWAPQHSTENCTYDVTSYRNWEVTCNKTQPCLWDDYIVMEGGFLHLSVKTVCNGMPSEPVPINRSYPDLVKNLQCYIRTSKQTYCSWDPASNASDLRFFYRLVKEDRSTSVDSDTPSPLQACSSYNYTRGIRTGCNLQATVFQDIHILFNGTLNNTLVRNTFKKELKSNVRPPPLTWNVTKTGEKFIITWSPPDIAKLTWKYTINYTVCNKIMFKDIDEKTSAELEVLPHCQYRMAIKAQAKRTSGGATEWSDEKYFDADTNGNGLVYAAIFIPLMFACLAALTFVCCRKNKDSIFPIIPEPRDLLSDISDNNNKSTVRNLYIPAEEEDSCKITLVRDPQNNKL